MIETPGGRGAVTAPCPSPATLGRLADAPSGDPGFLAVEAHLEDCPACQGVLERLAADSSVGEGREPKRVPPGEPPPTIAGFVIERELGRGGDGGSSTRRGSRSSPAGWPSRS